MKHARERIRRSRTVRASALRIRPLSAAVAAAMGVVPVAHAAGNVIVANGRTHTRIRVHGNTTDISTSTIRGSTAYNAFSQFREASGKIVNLKIPHKAVTLLNMVYGGQTVINGVLNAYHDGRLGGHVVFADPQGLIVGAHGVLNVGALTVTTPTRAFMNRVLSASGHIDQGATQQLIAGKAPQSADGLIRIVGRINALDGISLNAAQVLETASGHLSAGAAAYTRMKLFQASVNTRGLQQATHVVAHNGVISIEGGQSAQIAGTLQAGGGDHGGTIGVSAAHVTVADSARLDASGAQGGGSISVGGGPHAPTQQSTAQTVDIAKGASLVANATHRGDGGHVAVWSQSGTDFGGHIGARGGAAGGNGGQVEVSARTGLNFHGTVDTRAPQGLMGDLLLDPTNLDIVDTAPSTSSTTTDAKTGAKTTTYGNLNQSPSGSSSDTSYVTVSTLQGLGDTNITLQAFNQITVGDSSSGASTNLDLSKTLTSGKLTLEAGGTTTTGLSTGTTGVGDIKFVSGSSIETGGGSVVLDAGAGFTGAAATDGTATLGSISTQGGDITVNAGGGIDLPAGTTLDSTVSGGAAGAITLSAAQAAANGGGLLDLSTVYQSVSPVIANSATPSAATSIDVYGTITGGVVSLSASAQAAASFAGNPQETAIADKVYKKLGITTNTPLQAYQYTSTADAKVLIHNGAKITGEDVSLSSDAQPTITLVGSIAVPDGEYFSAMSAVLKGTSTAQIDAGATVSAAGDLSVKATAEPAIALEVKNALSGTGPSVTLAYGAANITTTAQIVTGATIDMPGGGNVDLGATNDQIFSLKASAAPTTTGNSSANIGTAAVIGNYNTQAIANEGANLSGVGDVTVSAASNTDKNVTSADTTATAGGKELKNGQIQESDQKTVLQSLFSSLLSAVEGKAGKTDTSSNSEPAASTSTSGSGTGGSGSGSTTSPSTTAFSLGSAVSLNLSDLSATASIAKTSGSTGSAPSISAGNVVVHAASSDPGFHNLANSETASTEPSDTTTGGSSTTGVSLAVALGWETGGAKASIGNGVTVNAANVAVGAENSTPLAFLKPFNEGLNLANELYTQAKDNFGNKGALLSSTVWTALGSTDKTAVDQFIADFKTLSSDAIAVPSNMGDQTKLLAQLKTVFANDGPALLNDYNSLPQSVKNVWDTSAVGKVVNEIKAFVTSPEGMSSYAQAKADKTSIAGAVNYLSLGSNAQAWVAPGATITLNALQSAQSWNSTVDGAKLKWDAPLTVQADDSTYALNGAGNGFLKGVGVTGGGGSSVGVGGAFIWVDASNSAQAWVANGVNITTAGNNLAVEASNLQRFASYAPNSGKGSGFAGNGTAAVTRVAGAIEAAIGNQATVNAGSGDVTLNAANSLDVLSIAGALAKAQQTGVGVGVALNFVDPTTSAGVLDTSSLSSGVGATAATSGQDCTATYCLTAGALNVEARTQAASIALGVAGAKAGGSSSSSTSTSGGAGTTSGTGSSGESKTGFIGTITGAFSSLKDKIKGSGQSVSGGLSKTSSAADNAQGQLSQQNTDASSTQTAATTTQSDAKSQYQGTAADTQAADAGGSSTSDTSGQPKMSLTIAGSVAANINKSQTQATLDAAKIKLTGSGGANVLAANDSLDLALAGAGAISSSGGSSSSGPSAAIAGTLGLNVLDHQTTASIDNGSSLALTDGGAGVNLRALSGGQAVSVGLGLAVSTGSTSNLATIVGSGSVTVDRNTTQAKLIDATLTDTGAVNGNGVNVQALDAVKVGTGGGSLMISKGGKAGIGMAVSVAMLQNHTTASMAGGEVSGFSGMAVQAFSPGLIGSAAAVAGLNLGSNTPLNLAGAVVVNEISNTTNATIGADATGKQASVTVDKSLTVQASSQDASALETVLNDSTQSLGYDFAGVGLDALGIDTSNGATAPTLGGQTDNGEKSPTFTAASSTPSSTPGASIIGVAGSFSLSKGGAASAGLSAVYNAIDNQITAQVGDVSVTVGSSDAAGTLDISASNATRLIGVAAGASVGQGKFPAVGSFSINNLSGNATTALLGDTQATTNSTTVQGAGKNPGVSVNASDSGTIWSGAGGVSAGGKAGVGAAMALNLAGQQTAAQVSHTTLTASGLTVGATSSSSIDSLAVAVAAARKEDFGGSLNLTIDTGKTQALVGNSDLTLTGALSNTATDSSAIWDGAGAVAASSAAGVGIGVAVNVTHHNTIAKLSSDTLSAAKQAVTVNAKNTGFIAAGGIGAAGSGKVAAGLGVVVNVAADQVSANVNDVNGGTPASAATLGSLGVSATDSSTVYALGGALAGAGNAALGGAVTVNWLGQQVGAGLLADTLDVGGALDVNATSSGKIGALAAAVAGGGNAAFAGAVTTNFISGSTTAADVNSTLSGVGLTLASRPRPPPPSMPSASARPARASRRSAPAWR
ncbi:MAG: leukotoxin LktA family filamentous adhesin [Acidihalobacter sp.]